MNDIHIHEKYAPLWDPDVKCRYFIITGGRGSGKSFGVSTFLTDLTCSNEAHKILFTRYTMKAAGISIIPEFQEKINMLGMGSVFQTKGKDDAVRNIQTKNEILFRGIKTSSGNQTANLKSIQGITTWVLDEAEELADESIFDTIDLSVRDKHSRNRVIILMNPSHTSFWLYQRFFKARGIPFDFNGVAGDTCYIHTSYLDNLENLSPGYLSIAEGLKKSNFKKYLHQFMGHWTDEKEGALWRQSTMIDPYRVDSLPPMKRIVIGVDPSVTSDGKQDECGIVAAGLGVDNHYYVMEDKSGMYSPLEWARVAVGLYKKHRADRIIAEVNNGGDLVEINLRNVDRTVPVRKVHASRGKIVRAEPVAGLYEQGLVHHAGRFYELETELTTYTGYDPNEKSPNRLDALVWALTELSGCGGLELRAIVA